MRKKYKFQKEKSEKLRRIAALGEVSCKIAEAIGILNALGDEELEDIRKAMCAVLDLACEKDKFLVKRDYGVEDRI